MKPSVTLALSLLVILLCGPACDANARRMSRVQATQPAVAQYVGPCDIASCAEAHSVTRAMTRNYNGPLFQLTASNGTTTLDIGQNTSTRAADMTTWSSICNVTSTTATRKVTDCKISKIYAQIQGHSNDLIPSVFSATQYPAGTGPNCTTGALNCAAYFKIDLSTNLPIADMNMDGAGQGYTLTSDAFAVGISGGTEFTQITAWYSGQVETGPNPCCAQYGITHKAAAPNDPGSNFMIMLNWSNNYPTLGTTAAGCSLTRQCLSVAMETTAVPIASYNASVGDNGNWLVSYDGTSNHIFTGYYNGTQMYSGAGGVPNSPTAIHVAMGGDATEPESSAMRSGFISNFTIPAVQAAAITANEAAFYGVTFNAPTGVTAFYPPY